MTLIFGHDKVVADWTSKQLGRPLQYWNHAVGIIDREGILIGCASFHCHNGSDIELCFHGPSAVRGKDVRDLMRFAFVGLGVNRVTARTPRQNKVVTQGLPKFGFKMEGVMRHYYGPMKRLDAIVFGLLKADAERFYT